MPGSIWLFMNDWRNILVNCGGKWVGIIVQLRTAMRCLPGLENGRIVVASSDPLTPAGCFADDTVQVPLIRDPAYIDQLWDVCRSRHIRVVIPMIDLDLERIAPHLGRFAALGTTVICPPPHLVELGLDKLRFARFADANGLNHLRTYVFPELDGLKFPSFYKRRRGFGSIGSGVCQSPDEAQVLAAGSPDLLFQELVHATEVTADAYIARTGRCIVCVPRIRDKVVAGESYKSTTVNLPEVQDLVMRTISALAREGLRGPLNVQMFLGNPPILMEVNTRLGSACVLSNMACGGRFLQALLHEALGGTSDGDPHDYKVGMQLSRFLGDVFHHGSEVVAVMPR